MIVFGGRLSPLGNAVAFVELELEDALEAYREWRRGRRGQRRIEPLSRAPVLELLSALLPLEMPYRRRLLVGTTTGWTAIFDNSHTGGDPFPPTYLAQIRNVRAVAATHARASDTRYPATQFHLFGPEGEPPLMYVRTIDAGVFDEGGWSFDAWGPEQPYEEPERYRRRLIRDRFTREMLLRYLEALGITPEDPDWYTDAALAHA